MLNKEKRILLIVILLLLLLVPLFGCVSPENQGTEIEEEINIIYGSKFSTVFKVYDYVEGNVCYVFVGYEKGGIDCMEITNE
jgi:hypothetical protein